MIYRLLLFFILGSPLPEFSTFTTPDITNNTILECSYQYIEIRDTITRRSEEDLMVLRIGKTYSVLYSHYRYFADSLLQTKEGKKVWENLMETAITNGNINSRPGSRTTDDYLFKNDPAGQLTTLTRLLVTEVKFSEPYESQNWQLYDSSKMIQGYTCHCARTSFRGRQYEAWYTPEIPVPEGPWKFCGLPGLILEIYDTTHDYQYTLVGLKTENIAPLEELDFIRNRRSAKTTRRKFLQRNAEIYFNSSSDQVNAMVGIDLGTSSKPKPRKAYDFIERDYK